MENKIKLLELLFIMGYISKSEIDTIVKKGLYEASKGYQEELPAEEE